MKNISQMFMQNSKKFMCTMLIVSFAFLLFGCERKEFNSDITVKDCEIYSMNDTIGKKGLKTVIERTVTEKISVLFTIYIPLNDEKQMELENPIVPIIVNVDITENGKIIASSLETNKELKAFIRGTEENDLYLISNFTYQTKDNFTIKSDEEIKLEYHNNQGVYDCKIINE